MSGVLAWPCVLSLREVHMAGMCACKLVPHTDNFIADCDMAA